MARILITLVVVVLMVIAVSTLINLAKSVQASTNVALGDDMPKTFQRIAYVVLILLMFGVVTGWLGAA